MDNNQNNLDEFEIQVTSKPIFVLVDKFPDIFLPELEKQNDSFRENKKLRQQDYFDWTILLLILYVIYMEQKKLVASILSKIYTKYDSLHSLDSLYHFIYKRTHQEQCLTKAEEYLRYTAVINPCEFEPAYKIIQIELLICYL